MHRLRRLAAGRLRQSELDILQTIFDTATAHDWFDTCEYSREGFAACLVGLSQRSIRVQQFEVIALLLAFNEFRNDMSFGQRSKLKALYDRPTPA